MIHRSRQSLALARNSIKAAVANKPGCGNKPFARAREVMVIVLNIQGAT